MREDELDTGVAIEPTSQTRFNVVFQPAGRREEAAPGEDLLTIARRAGVDIESSCGGKGKCAKCRIRLEGDGQDTGIRLACQTLVDRDLSVFVPEESRRAGTVAVKHARERTRQLDPAVLRYTVSLSSNSETETIATDLLKALAEQHGIGGLQMSAHATDELDRLENASEVSLAVVVWRDSLILDARPTEESGPLLGLALDVGTTTIAAYLTDLTTGEILATESALNPQVAYGDDIISRMQYAAHQKDGASELQQKVTQEVDRMAARATESCGATIADIYDVTVVGNTAIHHLFMGVSTESLRRAPFEPTVKESIDTAASEVGLHLHPSCRLYSLPNEAGFVGADNVAVIVAEEPYNQDEVVLLIDVGTNGELVLGDRRRMLSASCATGPAFEGAHIEHGMRAAPGAIERVRIDPVTLEADFKVIGMDEWSSELAPEQIKARGICGSGVIEAAAEMFKCGVVLPDGGFAPDLSDRQATDDRVLLEKGRPRRLVIATSEQSATGRPITVSLKDIRALQLGKAALRAGADILLRLYGIEQPDLITLAGAFGSYIDTRAALVLGMLPPCDPEKVSSVGNAAGDGALLCLLSLEKRREAEWAADAVEYVELASVEDFQSRYMEAMRFEPSVEGLL